MKVAIAGYNDCIVILVQRHRAILAVNILRVDILAPGVGIEPTTNALTAHCSTAELPGNVLPFYTSFFFAVQ